MNKNKVVQLFVVSLLLFVMAVILFIACILRCRSDDVSPLQGFTRIGVGFEQKSAEAYALVNQEANQYLLKLIDESGLGWDLPQPCLGDMCWVVPSSNGYGVVFWPGKAQRRLPEDLISKMGVFIEQRLAAGVVVQRSSGSNERTENDGK